jgi:hypothetical protein
MMITIVEQTLTAYIRGVMIAGLILSVPFIIAAIKDLNQLTKGDKN